MGSRQNLKNVLIFGFIFVCLLLWMYGSSIPYRSLLVWSMLGLAVCMATSAHKVFKTSSKIEEVFLIVFCVSLVIPTINITSADISIQEKRFLANLPQFFDKKGKFDFEFGKKYENWLKDHFFLRQNLIYLYSNIFYRLSVFVYKSQKEFVIKDGKYFLGGGGLVSIKYEDVDEVGRDFQTFQNYLSERGIKFYAVSFPTKNSLFRDHNLIYKKEENITKEKRNYLSMEAVEEILNKKYHINYMDMTKMFRDKMNEKLPVYKTDHHMNDYGYFLTYTRLIKLIQKDFPNIPIRTKEDFYLSKNKLFRFKMDDNFGLGVEHNQSNVRDKSIFDVEYLYFNYKDRDEIDARAEKNHFFHKNPQGKYKLLLIGDSGIQGFIFFLNTSFAEIDAYRVNQKKYPFEVKAYYKLIDKFKPDVVVFFRQNGAFGQFKSMYPQSKKGKK